MLFRAVFYGENHGISIKWIDTKKTGNWFSHNGRAYRIDREAVCQVIDCQTLTKGQNIRGKVEALYIEGNPVPMRSSLVCETITLEHLNDKIADSTNKPRRGLLDILLRRR